MSMSAFTKLPYPELTLTFIGSLAAMMGIWSLLILNRLIGQRAAPGEKKRSNKQPVTIALVVTLALGGLAYGVYATLQAKANAHFVALGHRACHSWSFASAVPQQSFAATVMGRYAGIVGFTCADVSEHFFDLASGRTVHEPPDFYSHISSNS
jgi:hypothetical protein